MFIVQLQELIEYRNKYLGPTPPPILALGLSSRKNLCIHPQVAGDPPHPAVVWDDADQYRLARWKRPVWGFFIEA